MQAYLPLYPMNSLMYIKSIVTLSLKLHDTVSDAMEICLVIVLYILVKPVLIKTTFKTINSIRIHHIITTMSNANKKLCYRRQTARRAMSVNFLNCRNKLYDKSTTNRMELEGYS